MSAVAYSPPVLLDFESRSRADLKARGGRRYWEHTSTQALCCAWFDTATNTRGVWFPGQEWPHKGRVLAAHNAHGFDRFGGDRYDFGAADWIDTSQLARRAGLPGALDALGTRWCGVPKDKEASKFTKSLSGVRRPKTISAEDWRNLDEEQKRRYGVLPELDAEGYARVVQYCLSDVEIMARSWPALSEWLYVDAAVARMDRVINDRGVAFDSALALRLLEEDERLAREAVEANAGRLGLTPAQCEAAARSVPQFCAMTGAPNAQAATVEAMDHPLATVRVALASIARGKLRAGLARVHADGRLRDNLLYYGGHTGRWSGRGMQLHNMPRPDKKFEGIKDPSKVAFPCIQTGADKDGTPEYGVDVDALAEQVLAGRRCDASEVSMLVRATVFASLGHVFVVEDFSSVEARATAWLARDDKALEVFRSGKDPYKVAATAIFEVEYDAVEKHQRQVGKVAELALGYQGGAGAFENMAKVYRLDLSGLDVPKIIKAWRELHAPIRDLWYVCERAFKAAVEYRAMAVGPLRFVHANNADAVAVFLPSGRPIVYNEPRIGEDGHASYLGTKAREHIYGGKLVENIVQALCRDLMAEAMIRAEAIGLSVVLTVHDEIVCEVPEQYAQQAKDALHKAMLDLPSWAVGMPIQAAGWVGRRYRK